MHPDGATGVLYKAGEKVATLTTDKNGAASVDNLYLGNYYVKEITPPVGYLADEAEHDLVCNYEGDLVATVKRSCVSPEPVKKQPFQIIKAANNGKTDADLLSGAGFTAYLVSSLSVRTDGSYDFDSASPVVIGENGATEMFTDEKGYACSIPLPCGTYVVRETTTPHNYTPVNNFIVRITEHHPNTPQVWRVLLDDEFEAKLKIIKQDDETKKPVLAKDTEFKIYDLDNKKYVEQVTTYPVTVVHSSYFTDEQGYLILPQNLKIGNYRIEEVQAPFGYTLNENYYEVEVDTNTAYQMDSVSGDAIIEVIYENHPVKGELRIVKQGEVLDGFKKDFTYQVENLSGAIFEVYAAEDIYTADFQKDGQGNRILEYASDTLVATLTTDDSKYQKWDFTDLPIFPEEWQLAVAKDKKEQFGVLKKLLNRNDLEYVVNACDAGREGELIFKRVYDLAGSTVPVKRLWISSMEDTAIRDGFAHLKEGRECENLCQSAVCRAKADWLIGMNATRAFTTKYFKRLIVGRVQTPTLAMLVERQGKIDGFVKEASYKVTVKSNGFQAVSGNIADEAQSDALVAKCQGKPVVISKMEKTSKKSNPPKLYDLTTLQREANRFFGYTAQETLKELQELYEAKLVTYPRTDSQYITADMEQTALELVEILPEMLPFLPQDSIGRNINRIINNDKVSDHHALLPTKEALNQDLGKLSAKQQNIFRLIGQRLAQAVSEECIHEETEIVALCEGNEFNAKGKVIVQAGFQEIASAFRMVTQKGKTGDKEPTGEDTAILEKLSEGMEIPMVQAVKSKHFTAPPKPYSEDTLLSAMETAGNKEFEEGTEKKGLGTPATRASIIEKLVSSGYAMRKGKQILPTSDGIDLVAVLPDYLKSAAMTAEWENKLLLMEKGQLASNEFMQEIQGLIDQMVEGCNAISVSEQQRFHPRESIGNCPVCGNPVYEGKKNFYCGDRECSFALWKENRYLSSMRKQIDKKMAEDLLKKGRTHVKDLYSQKKEKTFSADLLLDTSNGRANFKLEFPKNKTWKPKGK